MTPLIVIIAAFVGVSAMVGGIAFMFRPTGANRMEDRLDLLTGLTSGGTSRDALDKSSVLASPLDDEEGVAARIIAKFGNLQLLFEQADSPLTPSKFLIASAGIGFTGAVVAGLMGVHPGLLPAIGIACGLLPLLYIIFRRKQRLKKFGAQLSDALELVARALRAGHSLAAGIDLVSKEMTDPIAKEFGRVFDEQNLGVTMEDALRSLTERVPNLDLKFFATAIILQRQTGGDLAEILDKIGKLVRERFQIWGQVQALTGEGRLSGVVLLALPPVLFVTVYRMNPDYVMPLFTDPLGKQMLIGGIISQIVGAVVIRKIVNIKV